MTDDYDCPSCGAEMVEVRRIKIKAQMEVDEEPLTINDGEERIDLVCEDCGYEERGETRGIEVTTHVEEESEEEDDEEE